MKKVNKITLIFLSILFFVTSIVAISNIMIQTNAVIVSFAEIRAYENSQQYDMELKNLSHIPTLDENFDESKIIVILDCKHSRTKIKNSAFDFEEIVTEFDKLDNIDSNSIKELFNIDENKIVSDTYRRMLELKLKIAGKDKIIEAIEQLLKLDMVLSAEPKYNYEIIDDWVPADTNYVAQWGLNDT